jgi:hypothetical protein
LQWRVRAVPAVASVRAHTAVVDHRGDDVDVERSRSVQFLPGGRVRFSNYVYGGHWQQQGDSVTFDQNGVMLFDVVISGNVMSGTWRKLKGDDTRSTFPTSLRKTAGTGVS